MGNNYTKAAAIAGKTTLKDAVNEVLYHGQDPFLYVYAFQAADGGDQKLIDAKFAAKTDEPTGKAWIRLTNDRTSLVFN